VRMRPRTASRLAWSIGIFSIALEIGTLILMFGFRHAALPATVSAYRWDFSRVLVMVVVIGLPMIGIVLASKRPENPIGWMFLAAGLMNGLEDFGVCYGIRALVVAPGSLPAGRALAWMGSWNVTDNDTWRNNNNMLRFASRQIAADYAREFQQLFEGRFGTGKSSATPFPHVRVSGAQIEVYFSPEDGVAKYVLQRLAAAKRSIHFMTFSCPSSTIADAMVAHVGYTGRFGIGVAFALLGLRASLRLSGARMIAHVGRKGSRLSS